MKQSIATTQANFADIRRQNSVYVDKTKQIYDCFLGVDKYYFLARPRRFGKSMLCNTLREIFLGNKELFKGLWIEQSDWLWDTHPVIYLDMTFAAGTTNTVRKIKESLHIQLLQIAKAYNVEFSMPEGLGSALTLLTTMIHEKFNKGVVIIIDEYDKPILDLLEKPEQRNAVHAALRDFYSPLKPLESKLTKVFLTGVYKFTQTSIFSNLNNLQDLTFSSKASTLVGYTEEELEKYFSDGINEFASIFTIEKQEVLTRLRIQYNGYRFGFNLNTGKLSPSVYNSYAINNVFSSLEMVEKWFESGSPRSLIQKITEEGFKPIGPDGLCLMFQALKNSCSPDAINATSLLYYAGYATIKWYDTTTKEVRLGYPNLEVSEATANELIALFRNGTSSILYKLVLAITNALRTHQFEGLKDLFNQALAQLTYAIIESTEHYFQTVILLLLQMGRLRAEAEIPTNNGRMDIVVEFADEIIIIEMKFNEPAANGLLQIKDKDYAKKFRAAGNRLTAVGLSIALDKDDAQNKCVVDVAWEAL